MWFSVRESHYWLIGVWFMSDDYSDMFLVICVVLACLVLILSRILEVL